MTPLDNTGQDFTKNPRSSTGEVLEKPSCTIKLRNSKDGVILIDTLASDLYNALSEKLPNYTSAEFGLQMVEGVQQVSFVQQ